MRAGSNNKSVGNVVQAIWRPFDKGLMGTLVFEGLYEAPEGTDLVLYEELDGKMGKRIFSDFQIISFVDEKDFISLGFEASTITDWKQLGK